MEGKVEVGAELNGTEKSVFKVRSLGFRVRESGGSKGKRLISADLQPGVGVGSCYRRHFLVE